MSALKRFVLLFFLLLFASPFIIGGAALINDDKMPEYLNDFDYTQYEEASSLFTEVSGLVFANLFSEQQIFLDEVTVNKMIFGQAQGFKDKSIDLGGGLLTVKGVWTHIVKDELTVYGLVTYRGMETTLTVKINVTDTPDAVKLTLQSAKIGKLPLPKGLFVFILKTIEKNSTDFNIKEQFTYGDVNIDELYVTINKSYIKDLIKEKLGSDLIIFESLLLEDEKIVMNYAFDETNPQAVAIKDALNEVKEVINDPELLQDIEAIPSDDPDFDKFTDDLSGVIDLLKGQIENPDPDAQLTDEQLALFESLMTDYQNIDDPATQEAIVASIEGNIDPEVITEVNDALNSLDESTLNSLNLGEYSDITSLINGLLGGN